MPLQNRVDPFGDIRAVAERGMFTGNRGVIHDPVSRTLLRRRWTSRAWLVCALHWKDARRQPMGRNAAGGGAGWTELFFLDEVTALAAGHRPCFACRREQAKRFASCLGEALRIPAPRAGDIDALLHRERLASGGTAPAIEGGRLGELPDGAVVAVDGVPHALRAGRASRWTFGGYDGTVALTDLQGAAVSVLTPATTLAALSAGYRPVWHARRAG
jgi:hypothetical protein